MLKLLANREETLRCGSRSGQAGLGALEVEDRELGGDRVLRRAVAARGAFLRDRERLLMRLGQELVELLERLLVELERCAGEHDLGVVERAGIGRRREVRDDFLNGLAGQLTP